MPDSGEGSPNVLLILIDTLRADRLSLYGNPRPTSSSISRLAERALICDRAFSHAPWTGPSMASLFTSTYETVHQLSTIPDSNDRFSTLDDSFTTLAELLYERGYRTAGVSAQPWVSEATGFSQGFEEFFVVGSTSQKYESEKVALKALEWMNSHGDERFFLYLHFMAPHTPYDPPPPFNRLSWIEPAPAKFLPLVGKPHREIWDFMRNELEGNGDNRATRDDIAYLLSLYDAEVAHVDFWVGAVERGLQRLGLLEDTLIVLLADHGESFFEHGKLGHDFHLYNENLHIPLIFSHPALFPESIRSDKVVGIVDVMPTIIDLLGMESIPQFQGHSILGEGSNRAHYSERRIHQAVGFDRVRRVFGEEVATGIEKLQTREWSLLYRHEGQVYELYDLTTDPGETLDLFERRPEIARAMSHRMKTVQAANQSHGQKAEAKTTTLDAETLEQLRSLGYLD